MKSLREVWAWDGMDYVLQIGLICVFAYGALYASGANDTLTQDGCTAYWQEYNPGTNLIEVTLASSEEARLMREGYAAQFNYSENNSTVNMSNYK